MTLRWKTIGGLLLVAVLGCALALVFQRGPVASQIAETESSPPSQFGGSAARGRIVPLVIDDGSLLPAFVPTPRQGDELSRPLPLLPTIRASAVNEPIAPPSLSPEFPRPLDLPKKAASSELELPAATFAPIEAATVVAKPVIEAPIRHTIVDGDTLPDLAQRYLADRSRAREIFEQNRGVLSSPDVLPLRVEIVIGQPR